MFDAIFRPNDDIISLKQAWAIYLILLIAFCLVSGLFLVIHAGLISLIFYIVGGVYLNRSVLPRITIWDPIHSTVENVYKAKLQMFVLWPISYPILFLKLAVVKYL